MLGIVCAGIACGFLALLALGLWWDRRQEERQEEADWAARYMNERREAGLKDDEPEEIRVVKVSAPPDEQ